MPSDLAQAQADFRLKIELERILLRKLRKLNVDMVRAYSRELTVTGLLVDTDFFQSRIETMLREHYQVVGEVFTARINDQVDDVVAELTGEEKARKKAPVSIVVNQFYDTKAASQSLVITKTNRQNAADALKLARQSFQGVVFDELAVANTATSIFRQKLRGRQSSIVMFETQHSAEAAKLTQVEILSGEEPSLVTRSRNPKPSKAKKDWANLGDSRVRAGETGFDHLFAAQSKPVNKPFIVSGENLMFPGDTGLGASMGNVIGCRCSAVYDMASVARIIAGK